MPRLLPKQRLKYSPLVQVLAQVRFPPVFDMAERVRPFIYPRLQGLGFPRFGHGHLTHLRLEGSENPRVEHTERFDFFDIKHDSGVILTPEFVLLQTKAYTEFELLCAQLRAVLEIIGEEAKPAAIERVGLRFVNLVRPKAGQTLDELLKPGLVGYPVDEVGHLGAVTSLSRTETVIRTAAGRLAIRCFERVDGAFLPPDLIPSTLYRESIVPPGERVAILDLDHSTEDPIDFDIAAATSLLDALHNGTDAAFRGAVTPLALAQWGQESIP